MTLLSAQVAAVSHIKIYASIFNYNHPHNISGPAEYTPLALLVIVRDGGRSEKLGVQKSNKRAESAPHPRYM